MNARIDVTSPRRRSGTSPLRNKKPSCGEGSEDRRAAGILISDDTDSPLSERNGDVHEPGTSSCRFGDHHRRRSDRRAYGPPCAAIARFVTATSQPETAWVLHDRYVYHRSVTALVDAQAAPCTDLKRT